MEYVKKALFAGVGTAVILYALGKVAPTIKAQIVDPTGKS